MGLNYRLKGYFSRHCDTTQFTLTYSVPNHVNAYVLDGTHTLWEKRLVASARPKLSWCMRTTGSRCNPRPVATGRVSCVCDCLRDATGLDFGDPSWICNAALDSVCVVGPYVDISNIAFCGIKRPVHVIVSVRIVHHRLKHHKIIQSIHLLVLTKDPVKPL